MSLQNEIDKLKTLQESFNELSSKVLDTQAVLTELNHGKQDIVDAVNTKGVASSTDKTLSEIANDIKSIAQNQVTIDGGDLYETQLFGGIGDDALYWNLYKVMADILNNRKFSEYNGIILLELSKDQKEQQFEGAALGGAYYTSEGDFITEAKVYQWNDWNNGKANRWLAVLQKEEYVDVTFTTTYALSVHIGRKVGSVSFAGTSSFGEIVVTDGNCIKSINSDNLDNVYRKKLTFQNILEQNGILVTYGNKRGNMVEQIYADIESTKGLKSFIEYGIYTRSIVVSIKNIQGLTPIQQKGGNDATHNLSYLHIKGVETCAGKIGIFSVVGEETNYASGNLVYLREIIVTETEELNFHFYPGNDTACANITRFYFGYKTNDKTKAINISFAYKRPIVNDVELQNGWCKPCNFSIFSNLTEENMLNHILKRLKQDEELCGSGVTLTLGSTNLAKLTSDESVALLDSLTNTYGYTFA